MKEVAREYELEVGSYRPDIEVVWSCCAYGKIFISNKSRDCHRQTTMSIA